MLERIKRALLIYGLGLPTAIKELLKDIGAEMDRVSGVPVITREILKGFSEKLDRLQKEVDELRSTTKGE